MGATLGETGLKQRTALGMATLIIAANLPDVDMLAYLDGPYTALWFRRGLTHGIIAWLVLPLLLTGAVVVWDRVVRRRGGRVPERAVIPRQLFLLAFLGVLTHPLLDLLNTYGVRLLMPLSDRWFYGDTLFIVDPWVWAILSAGVFLARTRRTAKPATLALGVVSFYIVSMAVSNVVARRLVTRAVAVDGRTPDRLMVAPVPVNPFKRSVVVESEEHYRFGRWHWFGARFELTNLVYDAQPTGPGAAAATRGPKVRQFLSWARFPYWETDDTPEGRTVFVGDARYTLDARGGSWAAIAVH
jgi:inner membrane protein